MKRTKNFHFGTLSLISILLLAGLSFYIHSHSYLLSRIKNIPVSVIINLLIIHILGILFLAYAHQLTLKKTDIHLKKMKWMGLYIVSEFFNLLVPANGGSAIRMYYLKHTEKLSMRHFLTINFVINLLGFTLIGVIGLIYGHYFLVIKNIIIHDLLESFFISLTLSGFMLLFLSAFLRKIFKFKKVFSPKFYLKDYALILKILTCWLMVIFIYPLRIYFSFKAVGSEIQFTDSFEMSLILLASSLFQLLPSNIGIKEALTIYISRQYGIDFDVALLASLIDRALLILFLCPVGFFFYYKLFLTEFESLDFVMNIKSRLSKLKQSVQTSP
jgi:uncharacterized membrane protein YbhN (UPF0104 family)